MARWPSLHIKVVQTINNFLHKHMRLYGTQTKCKGKRGEGHPAVYMLPNKQRDGPSRFRMRRDSSSCQAKCVEAKGFFRRSLSSPVCCVCLFREPRFWSTDLAVTASDDRGIGEIAPGAPEDATVSEERKAS